MKLEYIEVGQIVNAHGIRGEVRVQPLGQDPAFLTRFKTLYLNGQPVQPTANHVHKSVVLLKLPGVDDMNAALALKGKNVAVRRSDGHLPVDIFFDQELVGLTARDAATGEVLGKVEEVLLYPAHKIYAVRGGKDEYLIPAVPAFIKEINLTEGYMDIHVWEGMGSHED